MKYLILGSSGQIGSSLVKFYKNNSTAFIEFDIANDDSQDLRIKDNPKLISALEKVDFVFFLAFDVGGSKYLKNHQKDKSFINNNLAIMYNTFNLLDQYKKPFIFSSSQMSDMSYSVYGTLKKIGEHYTELIGGTNVRFWNVYGKETYDEKSHVITDFIKKAKDGRIEMLTSGGEERQFLYVDDCCKCLDILSKNPSLQKESFDITNFEWTNINKIAEIVKNYIPCEIVVGKDNDSVQLDMRNEPKTQILKYWQPSTSIEDGIRACIEEN